VLWEDFMVTLAKRSFFFVPGLLILVLFLSSCGGGGSSSSSQYGSATTNATQPPSATQPVSAPATKDTSGGDYGKNYNTPAAAPTTAGASTTGIVVKTTSATVSGKALTILTDAQGMTLYYFQPDTASKAACTAGCVSVWPPLLFSGGTPQAQGSLPGSLQVASNANGKQITYNGHPLYTFSGDTAAGQTNGEGIAGKWFVAATDIANNQA
jgi:predicted lipoprotein with Yx(FWY)xxD motif